MVEKVPGYCCLCKSRCGVISSVENGRLVAIEPLPSHPTGRAICAKGRAAPEIAHSARRLTHPLKRTRPKGSDDPGWVQISWQEALGTIAGELGRLRDRHGAETVAFAITSPSATPIGDSLEWIERFIALFGSPNVCNATEICNWHKDEAHAFTFGCPIPQPDWANADLILLWGHNPASVWLAEAGEIAEAVKRGAKVAVIDPRRTSHARNAAHWLPVRPGTDAALALGLANLLTASGRVDHAFLRDWTNAPFLVRLDNGRFLRGSDLDDGVGDGGYVVFDEHLGLARRHDPKGACLETSVDGAALTGTFNVGGVPCRTAFDAYAARCAEFPLEHVAAITGVPASDIAALAGAIGDARSVCHMEWTGVGQHLNATQTSRAIATLYALTGHFDGPGGNVIAAAHPAASIGGTSLLPSTQRAKTLGAGVRPLGPSALGMVTARELYDAILDGEPYRVRALMTFGANLLLSRSDTALGLRALRSLDFYVHCDLFETPTARQADILLPVGGPWEREALRIGFDVTHEAQEWIQLRPALLPRLGESRSDAEIVCALASRLGFADQMFGGDIEAGWRHRLAPLGIGLEELRARPQGDGFPLRRAYRKFAEPVDGGVRGFATETGRVELYSELLLRHGYDPLPASHVSDHAPNQATADFPTLLTCAKSPYFCQSQHRGMTSLRRRAQEPTIAIAPELAEREAIAEGDWAIVSTRAGEARFKAIIDRDLRADTAVGDFGWWQSSAELGLDGYDPFAPGGSNFNRLIDGDAVDPVSGAPSLKAFACRVTRAPEISPRPWSGWKTLTITRREQSGNVVVLDLAAADGSRLPTFRPGQHVSVATDIAGAGRIRRSYSLCGLPDPKGPASYRIAVKRIGESPENAAGGIFSSYCASNLHVGGQLDVSTPAGSFVIPTTADFPIVLIAAGIGITPFLGYLEALRNAPTPPEAVLHYGSRSGAHHAFRDRIKNLAADLPSVRIVNHYSRPTRTDRDAGAFERPGRICADSIDEGLLARHARVYLCGPGAMMEDIALGLQTRGVAPHDIFSERFRSPVALSPSALVPGARYSVTFARSGRTAVWSSDKGSLLAFAESEGLAPPNGCRVGQCESCALGILEGAVTHLSQVAEIGEQACLACQAVPASDLVLDA